MTPALFTGMDAGGGDIADGGTLLVPVAVPAGTVAAHVRVGVTLLDPEVRDLRIRLIAPGGQTATVFDGPNAGLGVITTGFTGTFFDDDAPNAVDSGSPGFTGAFRPTQSLDALLAGGAAGTWQLEVTDLGLNPDMNVNGLVFQQWSLQLDPPAAALEVEPNDGEAQANPIAPAGTVTGAIATPGDVDDFSIVVGQAGRLTAVVRAAGSLLDPRLELFDGVNLLISSDDISAGDGGALILQGLPAGNYRLRVSSQDGSVGAYTLTTTFDYATTSTTLPAVSNVDDLAVDDVNGDDIPDILFTNADTNRVSVRLGLGDGTFREAADIPTGPQPVTLALGLLDGDALPDLAVVNRGDGTVTVYRNLGGGAFAAGVVVPGLPAGLTATALAIGGRRLFVATEDPFFQADPPPPPPAPGFVSVYTFAGGVVTKSQVPDLPAGRLPEALLADDLDGDGGLDLVVSNRFDDTIQIFSLAGGAFTLRQTISGALFLGPGEQGIDVAAGDIDGDGDKDLVVTAEPSRQGDGSLRRVLVLRNVGGVFQEVADGQLVPTGQTPNSVAAGDFNGDAFRDFAVVNLDNDTVSILLGGADGLLRPGPADVLTGFDPVSVKVADLNRDGKDDLVVANSTGGAVGVYLGRGDGTFVPPGLQVGAKPLAVVALADDPRTPGFEDLDANGSTDFLTPNFNAGTVSVRLGRDDGTFTSAPDVVVGGGPADLAVGDLNRDGRVDFVTADLNSNTVSVRLGNGDGTFFAAPALIAGEAPAAVALADLNRDGILDILVTNSDSRSPDDGTPDTVSVFLGRGDGTFFLVDVFGVGQTPLGVAVGDFNGDGIPDAAVSAINEGTAPNDVNSFGGIVSLHFGRGDGTFVRGANLPLDRAQFDFGPVDLLVTTTSAGLPVITVANTGRRENGDQTPARLFKFSNAAVFLGDGAGGFTRLRTLTFGDTAEALAAADLDGDGRPDSLLIATSAGLIQIKSLVDGIPQDNPGAVFVGGIPIAVTAADVNRNGLPDLLVVKDGTNAVSVLVDDGVPGGDVSFFDSSVNATVLGGAEKRSTPFIPPVLSPDPRANAVTLGDGGEILVRSNRDTTGGLDFGAPAVANPGRPARDVAVARTNGPLSVIAAADLATAGVNGIVRLGTVTVYGAAPGGGFRTVATISTTGLPTRVVARDLDGDGDDDLVILSADQAANTVMVARQNADGSFTALPPVLVGTSPTDVAFADFDGLTGLDLVVSSAVSGDVTVVYSGPSGDYAGQRRFRAADVPYSLTPQGRSEVTSSAQTVAVVTGEFTGDGRPDVLVVNRGTHELRTLVNDGNGGLLNAAAGVPMSTSAGAVIPDRAGPVVSDDFNHDGRADLAVLMQDLGQVWVYLGRAGGGFDPATPDFRFVAGSDPSGLSLQDVTTEAGGRPDGDLDLLISNPFGDLLVLAGLGDGRFGFVERGTADIPLDVRDQGDGTVRAAVASQASDRLTLQAAPQGVNSLQTVFQRVAGLGPSAVKLARLDGPSDPFDDIVVTLRDSNRVQVYRGLGNNTFAAPAEMIVGTAPTDVLVFDFDGDGVNDIATANSASNDLTVLRGRLVGGVWQADPNVLRFDTGSAPAGVSAVDMNGDGRAELLSTRSDGSVVSFENRGQGFFSATPVTALAPPPGGGGGGIAAPPRIIDGGRSIQVFADGSAFAVDLFAGTRAQLAVAGATAANLVALAGGGFAAVVGSAGGVFSVFTAGAGVGSAFNLAATVTDDAFGLVLDNPSALSVLDRLNGQLDIYVTTDGVEQAFLLTIGLLNGGPGGANGFLITPAFFETLAAVPLSLGPQLLVPALLFTLFPGDGEPTSGDSNLSDPFSVFRPEEAVAGFAVGDPEGGSGTEEAEEELPEEPETQLELWQQVLANLDKLLKWLQDNPTLDELIAQLPDDWRELIEWVRVTLVPGLAAPETAASPDRDGPTPGGDVPAVDTSAAPADAARKAADEKKAEAVWWPTVEQALAAGLVPPALVVLAKLHRRWKAGRRTRGERGASAPRVYPS